MGKKILIVDDEPNVVRLIMSRLKANGYDVVVAYDGLQAVRVAHLEKPDLILLDVRIPAGGGLTVYENLRQLVDTMMTPIVFVTALANDEMREKIEEMGADDLITKPVDPQELLDKVAKFVGGGDSSASGASEEAPQEEAYSPEEGVQEQPAEDQGTVEETPQEEGLQGDEPGINR